MMLRHSLADCTHCRQLVVHTSQHLHCFHPKVNKNAQNKQNDYLSRHFTISIENNVQRAANINHYVTTLVDNVNQTGH
jgi:hypothetical protein